MFICLTALTGPGLSVAGPPGGVFEYVLSDGGVPQAVGYAAIPEHLREAVARAEDELLKDARASSGALVYVVWTANAEPVTVSTELHYIGMKAAGYEPRRIRAGEPIVQVLRNGEPVELRVRTPGFELFTRKAISRPHRILIWNDIVLRPVTPATAGTVYGKIRLEDDADPEGIPVYADDEAVAFTDPEGYFVLDQVHSGILRVTAHKPG